MNGWMPERLCDMDRADDIRGLVLRLLLEAGMSSLAARAILEFPFALSRLATGRVPAAAYEAVEAARPPGGTRHAGAMVGQVLPPVLLVERTLVDGKHRCYAARLVNRGWVEAIDLAEAVPGLVAAGWDLRPARLRRRPPRPADPEMPFIAAARIA